MRLASLLATLLVALGAGRASASQPPPAAPEATAATATTLDPAALALVKRMCDRLRAARTFSVQGRTSLEGPVAGGLLATFFNDFETTVRRPNGLAARRSGDLPEFRFAYDGKTMAIQVPGKGTWASTAAPASIDEMLVAAGEQGDMDLPFDELLVADPYAAITKWVTDAVRAGQATVRGKKVEHVVLMGAALRVEYWIDPGTALPVRSIVVYLDHPLQPHFQIEFSSWKLDAKVKDATFALPRPQGATQVDFREAASAYR